MFIINNNKENILKIDNFIIRKIFNYFIKNKYENYYYAISFSGGLDSTVLLDVIFFIKNNFLYNLKIKAIHVNHNLNSNSNYWKDHCIIECKKRKIKLHIININSNNKDIKKYGIEFAYRRLRYKKIKKVLKKKEILLLAHHKNDNVETFLLSLKRGSGVKGLSSIKEHNIIYGCKIFRPLLTFSKAELKNYALLFKLNWIEDDSNFNNLLDRNFIRNNIITQLEKNWPKFIETASRSINLCYKNDKLLKELLNNDLKNLIKDNSINIEPIKNKSKEYINAIIRYWLEKLKLNMPSYKTINEIYKEILSDNINKPNLKIKLYENFYIKKYNNYFFCIKEKYNFTSYNSIWKYKENIFNLPYELGYLSLLKKLKFIKNKKYKCIQKIRYPNINEKVSIQINTVSNKLKIKIPNLSKRTSLKNIFQFYKVKPWERKKVPLIFYNEKLISIVGISITDEGLYKENKYLNLIWFK